MSFPIMFIWFLIAIFIFRHHMRKNTKASDEAHKTFWNQEKASLEIRRKELEEDDFIIPNLDQNLQKNEGFFNYIQKPELFRQQTYLFSLLDQKMVNFTHLTNTELRLMFGTATITEVEKYEDNYNNYIRTLYGFSKGLMESNNKDLAFHYLEEGLRVGTDIRGHYLLMAEYYADKGNMEGIQSLIEKAETLHTLTKRALIESLKTYVHTPEG